MSNQDNTQSMMYAAGENYEYIKTIIENKIEIKKLELIDGSIPIVSSIIMIVFLGLLLLLFSQVILALLAHALYLLLGSWLYSLSIISLLLLVTMVIIYFFGNDLIQNKVHHKILNTLDIDTNEGV
jgi:hypothetical protein